MMAKTGSSKGALGRAPASEQKIPKKQRRTRLKCGMVGGGVGSFIGSTHRDAMAQSGEFALIAGALSSTPEKARASGREIGLPDERNYSCWEHMLDREMSLPSDERIDLVSIVTPNHLHFPVAHAFAEAGIHVVCDKPLVHNSTQADELEAAVSRSRIVFGVTYNYSGYPLVKQARDLIAAGKLGRIRKVAVEFHQGWLASDIEAAGHKQAGWRTDPLRSGPAGALADIGSHAENLLSTVTALRITHVCADLTSFVNGRQVDDDGHVLLRLSGGAKGVISFSQIAMGEDNDLSIRVYGDAGSLSWSYANPDTLKYSLAGHGFHMFTRHDKQLYPAAKRAVRNHIGHVDTFVEAFTNIYLGVAAAIRIERFGDAATPTEPDYPTLQDGVRGVRFIEAALASNSAGQTWVHIQGQGL